MKLFQDIHSTKNYYQFGFMMQLWNLYFIGHGYSSKNAKIENHNKPKTDMDTDT